MERIPQKRKDDVMSPVANPKRIEDAILNIAIYMAKMDDTLRSINDNNVLHCRTLQDNSAIIKEISTANKNSIQLFKWLILLLTAALIVLAGAEKALKYVPIG